MSKKNKNIRRADKRKMEQLQKKKRIQKMIGYSTVLIAIVSIAVFIGISMGGDDSLKDTNPIQSNVDEIENQILIKNSDIGTEATFFSYDSNGVEIKYFIVEDAEKNHHAAFDACDVCYHAKKGYVQDGTVMRCINCGLTFPIKEIGKNNTGGGCWPSYLPIKVDGDNIEIEKSDLENKRYMFE